MFTGEDGKEEEEEWEVFPMRWECLYLLLCVPLQVKVKLSCSGLYLLLSADAGGLIYAQSTRVNSSVEFQCSCSAIECLSIDQGVRRGEASVKGKQ